MTMRRSPSPKNESGPAAPVSVLRRSHLNKQGAARRGHAEHPPVAHAPREVALKVLAKRLEGRW